MSDSYQLWMDLDPITKRRTATLVADDLWGEAQQERLVWHAEFAADVLPGEIAKAAWRALHTDLSANW